MTTRQLLESKLKQIELLKKHIATLEQMVAEEEGGKPVKFVPRPGGRGGRPMQEGSPSSKVLEFLRGHPGPQTTTDIAAAFDWTRTEAYRVALSLSKSGKATRTDVGTFQLGPAGAEPIMKLAKP